jgi:hypothetical protein
MLSIFQFCCNAKRVARVTSSCAIPKLPQAVWVNLFSLYSCLSSLMIACRPPRRRSASRVYRSASSSVVWPRTAMISCAVAPRSARRRPSVLRRPCGLQSSGRPAARIGCAIMSPNAYGSRNIRDHVYPRLRRSDRPRTAPLAGHSRLDSKPLYIPPNRKSKKPRSPR